MMLTLAVAVAVVILIEVSIAGYFVYTIVPYNKADADWTKRYADKTKGETE